MRRFVPALALLAAVALSTPAIAGSKAFASTSDYKKDSEMKGYLNLKFKTYETMFETPKGTDCDWVMRAPEFNLADLRKVGSVTYYAGGLSAAGSGNPYLDLALMQNFYGNGLATAFESAVMSLGIQTVKPNAQKADDPSKADQARLASLKTKLDADLTGMDLEVEKALFDEDKGKVGVSEAVKLANARKEERTAKITARIAELEAKIAATKPVSANPEDQSGFSLILYLMDSGISAGSYFSPVATNSTTAEFILLKDGKPMLAGRHCAVSAMFGSSTQKCGQKLATAFNIK